jgi:hypothetical protein
MSPIRIALVAVVLLVFTGLVNANDETREPPAKYRLELEGKAHLLTEGEPLKLTGSFNNPTAKILPEPHREFTYGGVSFLYPRAFMFEADLSDPANKQWTLSGNDFKIMYFVMSQKVTPEQYARSTMKQLGEKNCKLSEVTTDLLGKKLPGTRLEATITGHRIIFDIFTLPATDGSRLLILQDNPDEAGRNSKEGQESVAVLKKSLTMK